MLSNILSCQSSCPHFPAAFLRSRGGLLSSGFLRGFGSAFVAGLKSPGTIFTLLSTSEFKGVEGLWVTRIQGWRTQLRVGGATYVGGARQREAC